MRRIVFWIAPLVLVPALWGQDEPKDKAPDKKPATPAEQYQALVGELNKAQLELSKAYGEAGTEAEEEKVEKEFNKVLRRFIGRFLELAEKNPKDKVAYEALRFVAVNAQGGPEGDKAVEIRLKNHTDKLARQLPQFSEVQSPAVEKLLRGFLEKSTDPKDRGQATLSLAKYLKNRSESPELKPGEAERTAKEAEDLFTKVADKYASVGELAETAKEELAELRTFGIGKVAPEIEGEDIDGKKFKLSDYRGKVVVLDFWGNW